MKRIQRQKKLIDYLRRANEYVTVKQLAEYLNVSPRTIHYELESIKHSNQNYILVKKPGIGIQLILKDHKVLNYSDSEIEKNIAKRLVLNNETITFENLSNEYYISFSSIKIFLKNIENNILKNTDARLCSNNKGTKINGTEISIQSAMVNYNCYYYDDHLNITEYKNLLSSDYDQVILENCLSIILELSKYNLSSPVAHYIKNIFDALIVLCSRLKKQKHILNSTHNLNASIMQYFLVSYDILKTLSLNLNFKFKENDVVFIAVLLQGNRLEFITNKQSINHLKIEALTQDLILKVAQALNKDLVKDKQLKNNLYMHIYYMLYRLKNNIAIKNPLIDQIKKEFRVLFDMVYMIVEMGIDQKITEDEVSFLLLHFQTAIDKLKKPKTILVFLKNNLLEENYILNRIKKVVRSEDEIIIKYGENLEQELIQKSDLIITDSQIKEMPKPIVMVTPLINELDLINIHKAYPINSQYLKKEFKNYLDYIDKQLIFINPLVNNKKEIIDLMCLHLEKLNYVTKEYKETVYERERKGSSELYSKAAIPHGNIKYVKKSVLSILTSTKPIKWDDEFVCVVIMIVISYKDLTRCKYLLSKVHNLVKTKQKVSVLLTKDKEQIIKIMADEDYDN